MYLEMMMWLIFLVYLVCGICWACILAYSLFSDKGRTRWLRPTLMILALIGLSPLLIVAVLLFSSHISNHNTASSVSGNYSGSFSGGTDTLTLHPNGTFSQRFVTTSGKTYTSEGEWKLNAPPLERFNPGFLETIDFDKIILHADNHGRSQKPKVSDFIGAEPDRSEICFSTNESDEEETGYCFARNAP